MSEDLNFKTPTKLSWDTLPGETEYDDAARVHKGIYTSDYKLSEHFSLSTFKRDGHFMVSEFLIEKLEDMFNNFPVIKSYSIGSAYRFTQPGNYTSMHNLGGAVDIAWLDENGKKLDAKYIACAAAWLGFGGVAPLEKPGDDGEWFANSIHMDVRYDYATHKGSNGQTTSLWKKSSCWHGYERDPDGDGWFSAFSLTSNYGKADAFLTRYELTQQEVLAFLGTSAPPKVYRVIVQNCNTTEATFTAIFNSKSPVTSIKYVIVGDDGSKVESILNAFESTDTTISFTVQNLLPGTNYRANIELISGTGISKAPALFFTTVQDYPKPGSIGSLRVYDGNPDSYLPNNSYQASYSIPSNYNCFWESYGAKNLRTNYKGFNVVLIVNGEIIDILDSFSSSKITVTPADYNITFGNCIQLGIQTWIKTNKKINSTDYEVITSDLICTKPIYLDSEVSLIKRLYIKDSDTLVRVLISALKEGT